MHFSPQNAKVIEHAHGAENLLLWTDDSGALHLHEERVDDIVCIAVLDELHTRALIGMLEAALEVDD